MADRCIEIALLYGDCAVFCPLRLFPTVAKCPFLSHCGHTLCGESRQIFARLLKGDQGIALADLLLTLISMFLPSASFCDRFSQEVMGLRRRNVVP